MSPKFHQEVFQICRSGFRRNLVPGFVLQSLALTLVVIYYYVPACRPAFEALSEWKRAGGTPLAAGCTAICAGLLPFLIFLRRGTVARGQALRQAVFHLAFWAIQGAVVNEFYAAQGRWFGDQVSFQTLLLKVLVDQGPFNLLYATPFCMTMYRWKDVGFRWPLVWKNVSGRDWWLQYVSIQISVWITWIPAVTIVYSLPQDLQFPLFLLVLTFFTLVLRFVANTDINEN